MWREEVDGTFTVLDVPIFSTLEANAHGHNPEITPEWLDAAKARFEARKADGYLPPLHLRHHGFETARRAGHFEITRRGAHRVDGEMLPTLYANLTRIPRDVFAEIRAQQWPYRSVEIHDYSAPEIDSLALLDSEVPFFRYPCMQLDDGGGEGFSVERCSGASLRAVASRGRSHVFLFRSTGGKFMDPENDDQGGDAAPEMDLDKLADALYERLLGRVMERVMEAVNAAGGSGDEGEETDDGSGGAMSAKGTGSNPEVARLAAEVTGLSDKLAKREEKDRTRERIDAAMAGKLSGANLGQKGRETLERFAASMGEDDWSAYVAQLAATVQRDDDDTLGDLFAAGESQPDEVAKYANDPNKYAIAKRVAQEYSERKRAGLAQGYTLEWKIEAEIRRAERAA